MDVTKTLETDVLVVGAGNAASVAALAAHDLGAKVLLLERAPKERRGGNSAFSGGLFRFAFHDFEQLKSIVHETAGAEFQNVEVEPYPKDRFYGDLMRVTDGLADPVLTELLVERSQDVVNWMAQHGVVWELHLSHCARVKDKLVWRTGKIPVAAREGGKGLQGTYGDAFCHRGKTRPRGDVLRPRSGVAGGSERRRRGNLSRIAGGKTEDHDQGNEPRLRRL